MTAPAATVDSPCINICKLDAARTCTGCGRTIAEIARWGAAGDEERRAILAAVALRQTGARQA